MPCSWRATAWCAPPKTANWLYSRSTTAKNYPAGKSSHSSGTEWRRRVGSLYCSTQDGTVIRLGSVPDNR